MPRFNPRRQTPILDKPDTTNLAGGEAYTESPELELASILFTSFVQDQFYRSADDGIRRVRELLDEVDPLFAAKTAVHARTKYHMRSITHVIAAEIVHRVKGEQWTRPFIRTVVQRVDDMTEIMAYYMQTFGVRPVPNALKRGLADAFGKFDAYQLARYRGEGNAVKLVDVVNLVRPKGNEKNSDAFRQLVAGELRQTETWEAKMSATEGDAEAKAEVWKQQLESGRIGYMALVRNLRNILQQAPELTLKACVLLEDGDRVRGSRMLPFRFVTAIEEISKLSGAEARKVVMSLSVAAEMSLANVPDLDGETVILLDHSGSMNMGNKPAINIGSLFTAIMAKKMGADVIVFDTKAAYRQYNPNDSVLTIRDQFVAGSWGGGTNFQIGIETMNRKYDRIIILSDMQPWIGMDRWGFSGSDPAPALAAYQRRTGAKPKVFSFDLAGYGTLQVPQRDVYALAGFSDRVFDVMKMLEEDREAMLNDIRAVQFE